MASVLELILPELFERFCEWLPYADLLGLRRLSKKIKQRTDEYLQNPRTKYGGGFVTVFENGMWEDNIELLLEKTEIPITEFRILNDWGFSFDSIAAQQFARNHGHRIKHLRLKYLHIPFREQKDTRDTDFFRFLTNLSCLHIEVLREGSYYTLKSQEYEKITYRENAKSIESIGLSDLCEHRFQKSFPNNLRPLQCLKISKVNRFFPRIAPYGYVKLFSDAISQNLEHFQPPEGTELESWMLKVCRLATLREIDTKHLNFLYDDMLNIARKCGPHVKLTNVKVYGSGSLANASGFQPGDDCILSSKLKSLETTPNFCMRGEFLNLESLNLFLRHDTIGLASHELKPFNPWPQLKRLFLVIREKTEPTTSSNATIPDILRHILKFSFVNLEELSIDFDVENHDHTLTYTIQYSFMNSKSLSQSFPNVKILSLSRLPCAVGPDSHIWTDFPSLEEIRISECFYIGDTFFFGPSRQEPACLAATRLKTLVLEGLDYMTGITDDLFRHAVCEMSLRKLVLTTPRWKECRNVSMRGLQSLEFGVFSTTIEKLTLDVVFKGVHENELSQFIENFRSRKLLVDV